MQTSSKEHNTTNYTLNCLENNQKSCKHFFAACWRVCWWEQQSKHESIKQQQEQQQILFVGLMHVQCVAFSFGDIFNNKELINSFIHSTFFLQYKCSAARERNSKKK
jgi:hypothetical protein